MAGDPRTTLAATCSDDAAITVEPTPPLDVLRRLPEALFDLRAGDAFVPALLAGDILDEDTIFGPIGGGGTPQLAIARILAEERDHFRLGWLTAEAIQHATGMVTVADGRLVSESPHARGTDLDKLAGQFGLGRPDGFSDCCYWRLIQLVLFQPGPTAWRLVEIADLYTGVRPSVIEEPARIRLTWPRPRAYEGIAGLTFFDHLEGFNAGAFWTADPPGPDTALDSYWSDVDDQSGEVGYWHADAKPAVGTPIELALSLAKPAGVFVALVDIPRMGASGCGGATTRTAGIGRGAWSTAPADIEALLITDTLAQSEELA